MLDTQVRARGGREPFGQNDRNAPVFFRLRDQRESMDAAPHRGARGRRPQAPAKHPRPAAVRHRRVRPPRVVLSLFGQMYHNYMNDLVS